MLLEPGTPRNDGPDTLLEPGTPRSGGARRKDGESDRATQLEVARTIALDLLTARQRSAHELRAGLLRRRTPPDVADEVVERLAGVGLVDDVAFAEALTTSRVTHSQRGRARIRQELREKGVDREVAEAALAELDPEAELEGALALARRRARSLAGLEPHVARRRLAGVLARRGYSPSIVSTALAEALGSGAVEFPEGDQ
ncbi:MAG TPA: regulatory protein RecX [Arachnia sp.]|nr:regulatory protein RecX [Arachnia sp.]